MKYGLTVKDMNAARRMIENTSLHDWVMLVLKTHYAMRKREADK